MFKSFFKQLFFVLRIAIAWGALVMLVTALYSSVPWLREFEAPMLIFAFGTMALVLVLLAKLSLLALLGAGIGSTGFESVLNARHDPLAWQIVMDIRLPRTAAALLADPAVREAYLGKH